MQLRSKKSGAEWIDKRLWEAIGSLSWPVAFVDFGTILMSMPWYVGLRPGQVLPLQFSAHILHQNGDLEQEEWINTRDEIPTFEFIKQLRTALDGVGSILTYTNYENQILEQSLCFLRHDGAGYPEGRLRLHAAPGLAPSPRLPQGRHISPFFWISFSRLASTTSGARLSLPAVL